MSDGMRDRWTPWSSFPVSRGGNIPAPPGPGVYEICNASTRERVSFGCTRDVAAALQSIVEPTGLRKWLSFRRGPRFVLREVEYRVWPTSTFAEAKDVLSLIRDRREAMLRRFASIRA